MPTEQPLTLKCPSCRAGQYGRDPAKKGVRAHRASQRERRVHNGRRRGGRTVLQTLAECLDCGHVWWTTYYDGVLKRRRWEQLSLPTEPG